MDVSQAVISQIRSVAETLQDGVHEALQFQTQALTSEHVRTNARPRRHTLKVSPCCPGW